MSSPVAGALVCKAPGCNVSVDVEGFCPVCQEAWDARARCATALATELYRPTPTILDHRGNPIWQESPLPTGMRAWLPS